VTAYHRYRQRGQCVRCGEPHIGSAYCDECARVRSESRKRRYRELVEQRICPQCGRQHDEDRVHCADCRIREKLRACAAA